MLEKNVLKQLEKLKISEFFDGIYVVPQINVSEKNNVLKVTNPDYFIGDTLSDYDSTLNTDVKFIPVCSGMRSQIYWQDKKIKNTVLDVNHFLKTKINMV